MKAMVQIFLLLLPFFLFSQSHSKPDLIKKISAADTVSFIVTTSGCFDAGTTVYKLVKKKKQRWVILVKNTGVETKKITAKDYERFIKNYRDSFTKFSNMPEGNPTCTMTTEFELKDGKQASKFTNTSCEAEFNPEEFLKKLITYTWKPEKK